MVQVDKDPASPHCVIVANPAVDSVTASFIPLPFRVQAHAFHLILPGLAGSRVVMSQTGSQSSLRDSTKHPHFMGLTGRPLSLAVSIVATTGFLLFGYDRKSLLTIS